MLELYNARLNASYSNTGSKASTAGSLNGTVYVASKHSVLGMSRCLAREEAKNNIRVNRKPNVRHRCVY